MPPRPLVRAFVLLWWTVGLVATFVVAFIAHLTQGQFRGDLIIFAVGVSFVAVHGPVPVAWLRKA
jgi:hypothetical protein